MAVKQSRFLWAIVVASLLAVALFPIYTFCVLAPRFEQLLVDNTRDEAVRLASCVAAFVADGSGELASGVLPAPLRARLTAFTRDGHLVKMRIFSADGRIVYSTAPHEVGTYNRAPYFNKIRETRTGRAEVIPAAARSLENEVFGADVVETYVPITSGERLFGVFELYHDVSKAKKGLTRLLYRSYGTLFALGAGLLTLVALSSWYALRSVRERERTAEQLKLLSLTDDLTGLYNRRGFLALAEQQLRVAERDEKPLMVVSADLDGLKAINDGYGHQAGDAAIVETARVLRDCFRKSDLIARVGGDEFAVLLTGGEAEFNSGQLGSRLGKAVDRHNGRKGDALCALSISAGFAYFDVAGTDTFEELLHRADTRMYEEKRRRKGERAVTSKSPAEA